MGHKSAQTQKMTRNFLIFKLCYFIALSLWYFLHSYRFALCMFRDFNLHIVAHSQGCILKIYINITAIMHTHRCIFFVCVNFIVYHCQSPSFLFYYFLYFSHSIFHTEIPIAQIRRFLWIALSNVHTNGCLIHSIIKL